MCRNTKARSHICYNGPKPLPQVHNDATRANDLSEAEERMKVERQSEDAGSRMSVSDSRDHGFTA